VSVAQELTALGGAPRRLFGGEFSSLDFRKGSEAEQRDRGSAFDDRRPAQVLPTLWRPARRVDDAQNLDGACADAIWNEVPSVQNHKLARIRHASRPAKARLIGELCYRLQQPLYDQARGGWVVDLDVGGLFV
jgi:hypothetical protein